MRIVGPQITLNPGLDAGGKRVSTATVRLLTFAERDILNQIADLDEQNKAYFVEQIHSFGGNEDRQHVANCRTLLTFPDEERLNHAMNDLIAQYRDPRFKSNGHQCPTCGADVICERAAPADGKE